MSVAFLPQFLDTPPALLDPRLVLRAPAVRRWLHRSLGTLLVGFAARLAIADR